MIPLSENSVAMSLPIPDHSYMLKNTLIVYQNELAATYRETMLEYLNSSCDSQLEDAEDLATLGQELQGILSKDLEKARQTLLELFKGGYTMNLLSPDYFETLEKWYAHDEAFQIIVFSEDGKPIGAFKHDVLYW